MNFLKKNKAKIIAVSVSITFYGLLLLLLLVVPNGDSSLKSTDEIKNKEEEIKFQIIEEIPLQPSVETQKTNVKNLFKELTKESQPKANEKTTDENKDFDQSDDETNVIENQDSVMLVELKKALVVLKDIVPKDSLAKNTIEEKKTQKVKEALTEKTHYSEEEWQFIRNNYRMILSIRKVYPYVQKTKQLVDDLNKKLATIKNNHERNMLIKETEKALFKEYEKDVRSMSYSQGKLLLKLLARETDQSAYGLIKTYKGGIPATFWYGVGLLFQENLKVKYDSLGEDALLEQVVKKYKIGKI
jgi:hypothetical protein